MSEIYQSVPDFGNTANKSFAVAFNVLNEMAETRKRDRLQELMLPLQLKKAEAEIAGIEMMAKQREAQFDLFKAKAQMTRSMYEADQSLPSWTEGDWGSGPSASNDVIDIDEGAAASPTGFVPEADPHGVLGDLPGGDGYSDGDLGQSNALFGMADEEETVGQGDSTTPQEAAAVKAASEGAPEPQPVTDMASGKFDASISDPSAPTGDPLFDATPAEGEGGKPNYLPSTKDPSAAAATTPKVSTVQRQVESLLSRRDAEVARFNKFTQVILSHPGTPQAKQLRLTAAQNAVRQTLSSIDRRLDVLKPQLPKQSDTTDLKNSPAFAQADQLRLIADGMAKAGDNEGALRLLTRADKLVQGDTAQEDPVEKIKQVTGFDAGGWKTSLQKERSLQEQIDSGSETIFDPEDPSGKTTMDAKTAKARLAQQSNFRRFLEENQSPVFTSDADARKFASLPYTVGLPIRMQTTRGQEIWFSDGKGGIVPKQPLSGEEKDPVTDSDLMPNVQTALASETSKSSKKAVDSLDEEIQKIKGQISELNSSFDPKDNTFASPRTNSKSAFVMEGVPITEDLLNSGWRLSPEAARRENTRLLLRLKKLEKRKAEFAPK